MIVAMASVERMAASERLLGRLALLLLLLELACAGSVGVKTLLAFDEFAPLGSISMFTLAILALPNLALPNRELPPIADRLAHAGSSLSSLHATGVAGSTLRRQTGQEVCVHSHVSMHPK